MKSAQLLVNCLENEGVRYIFGIPGEENLEFIEALRNSYIDFIVTRHEQAAAFMAATYGRLTGQPGVVLSTLGPGVTNLTTGIAYAQLGGMPLVAIAAQKPIHTASQGLFQQIDAVGMMMSITKSSVQIESGNRIPIVVRNSFRIATEERPGAVFLEFPLDVSQEQVANKPIQRTYSRRPAADRKSIEVATKEILESKRPLIMIGAGANRKRISKYLTQFISDTGINFFTTQMGKGVVDERSAYYLGCSATSRNDIIHSAISNSDLIISVGHDLYEKPPMLVSKPSQKIININFYPSEIDEMFIPSLDIVGDIAGTINDIYHLIMKNLGKSNWKQNQFESFKIQIKEMNKEGSISVDFPIKPQRFVHELRDTIPHDAITVLDNGLYKLWIAKNMPAYYHNSILLDNALASMGAGLPSGIVTKLMNPRRKVVIVCGDGGFMMNSQELETAVRLKLNLVIIILKDNSFGMIKNKQEKLGFKSYGISFGNPDFVAYAQSYGVNGSRVESSEQFSVQLKEALQNKGVSLIELPIDYRENIS
jgi:acetolactate synthase-1/2/3 large subunit